MSGLGRRSRPDPKEPNHSLGAPVNMGCERAFPILTANDISVRFGGVQALNKANLASGRHDHRRDRPERVGEVDPVQCVTGVTRADSGSIRFRGTDITGLSSHQINRSASAARFSSFASSAV